MVVDLLCWKSLVSCYCGLSVFCENHPFVVVVVVVLLLLLLLLLLVVVNQLLHCMESSSPNSVCGTTDAWTTRAYLFEACQVSIKIAASCWTGRPRPHSTAVCKGKVCFRLCRVVLPRYKAASHDRQICWEFTVPHAKRAFFLAGWPTWMG